MSDPLPPPVFRPLLAEDPAEVGGYRLYARLGAGGMGRVYLSYTPGGRPVALKVVRPEFAEDAEFRRRFAQEVLNARRIHGLYTAQVIDSGLDAEAPWLVTAYVPGPSLQQVVREHGALPVRTVLLLLGGIAEALQAIHGVGVVHRDLKPANVLIAGDGPRVIDFGIARAADATALTGTGFRIGSPAFMAPEQAQGHPVTPATDVFALGALAAYVAGGVPPFGEGPETAVLYRVVHEEPVLDGVPAELRGLLLRCLAKRPEDRPAPAEIIEVARAHPAVGGLLRFGDDWLPAGVGPELTRRSDLPHTPPAPLPTAPAGPPPPAIPPTAPVTVPVSGPPVPVSGPPVPAVPPAAGFGPPPAGFGPPPAGAYDTTRTAAGPAPRRGSVSWKTLLAVSVVMVLAGTAAGVALKGRADGNGAATGGVAGGSAGAAGSPQGTARGGSAEGRYTEVYRDRELHSPDYTYSFDLAAGKVVSDGASPSWELEPGLGRFTWSGNSDVFVSRDGGLTPEQCAAGIDRAPVTDLAFDALPVGRVFCVRNRVNGGVAVVTVLEQGNRSTAEVRLSASYYRHDG
ncbi:serine/threonine-protein kinase [Kitasatospora terrestris]|uniref:Protein kinase domain-containing protein n=1 Tax=Kitasatospora terrestris TaxID=258051 RepID=A0ABP9DZZ0_9ACTN